VRPRGTTLLETVVSLGIFSLLSIVLFSAFKLGTDLWRSVDSRTEGLGRIQLCNQRLTGDIVNTAAEEIRSKRVPGSGNGDAIWFLSNLDPTIGDPLLERYRRDDDGAPLWQRNIIYYLIRPANHDAMVGQSCQVDSNPEGDAICPHKMLIRKVVNVPADPEALLDSTDIDQYLTAPTGFDTSVFSSEPDLEEARIIAPEILWFQAVNHSEGDPFIELELRSLAIEEANRNVPIGNSPLARFVITQTFSLFPGVQGEP
jgi:hypothetical protein